MLCYKKMIVWKMQISRSSMSILQDARKQLLAAHIANRCLMSEQSPFSRSINTLLHGSDSESRLEDWSPVFEEKVYAIY